MITEREKFKKLFLSEGYNITDEMYDRFDTYSEYLVEQNKTMNLTRITDPEGITVKHFLDSLAPAKYYDIPEKAKLIDVGTGAGFPSVPLKIYRNDIDITLLDSLAKRVDFLKRLTEKLGIDARCVHIRAEDGGKDDSMRECYDIASARAVAALPVLCEYCLPFVKMGGVFIAMKGPSEDIKEADNAVKLLGGQTENIIDYALDNGDRRIIVIIRKISHTPPKYPRNSAQISKRSL